jgi:hypothetical protein
MIYRFKLICEGIPYNKVGSKQNGAPDPSPKDEYEKVPPENPFSGANDGT